MQTSTRSVLALAATLLAGLGVVFFFVVGASFAAGFVAAGVAVLVSFVVAAVALEHVTGQADTLVARIARLVMALKLPVLLGALWVLFSNFAVLSVVLGASVLIVSITGLALIESHSLRIGV